MKKLTALILVFLLCFAVVSNYVQAQEAISATYSTEAEFPTSLTFNLTAKSNADITRVILNYKIEKITTVTVISEVEPDFDIDRTVETSWTWDMRQSSLPPGAKVQYRWRIEDAAGHEFKTSWETVRFDDNRYSWKSLTEDEITLYWYKGDQSFAQELLKSGLETLELLANDTGAYLEQPVDIYIYASSTDLQGAMISPQEWTGGVAFVDYGILAIGVAPAQLTWGKRAMSHELAHLVTYQMTYNPYGDIPTWLSEGLSMYAEGDLDLTFRALLDNAIARDNLISVQSLSSSFPTDVAQATLSYAESYSLVEFLIQEYGSNKMLELLDVFKQGSTYDDALEQVYGFNTTGLNDAWRLSLGLNPRDGETPAPQISPTPKPPGGFLQCRESLGQTSGGSVMVFAALGLLLLPGLGEFIRLRAKRGKG